MSQTTSQIGFACKHFTFFGVETCLQASVFPAFTPWVDGQTL